MMLAVHRHGVHVPLAQGLPRCPSIDRCWRSVRGHNADQCEGWHVRPACPIRSAVPAASLLRDTVPGAVLTHAPSS